MLSFVFTPDYGCFLLMDFTGDIEGHWKGCEYYFQPLRSLPMASKLKMQIIALFLKAIEDIRISPSVDTFADDSMNNLKSFHCYTDIGQVMAHRHSLQWKVSPWHICSTCHFFHLFTSFRGYHGDS